MPHVKLFLETSLPDIDGTRFTINFGDMPLQEMGDLTEKLGAHSDLVSETQSPLNVYVFVPADIDGALREEFLANVQAQIAVSNPDRIVRVEAVVIDLKEATEDHRDGNRRIAMAMDELADQVDVVRQKGVDLQLANDQTLRDFNQWDRDFPVIARKYLGWRARAKNWWSSGYTSIKDERIGGWIGKIRGGASAAVWIGFNHVSLASAFQIPASFFLDWFFSKYERKVDIFKAVHRIPLEGVPIIKHAVRFYNERPLLKSWIVGNLIGWAAGTYFRFWSWVEDPARTSAPWSVDALETYVGALGIGNLSAAFGAQGPRILRQKGYVSSRTEYYMYSSYGILFQLGG